MTVNDNMSKLSQVAVSLGLLLVELASVILHLKQV